jgi:hypothetical protein
LNGEPGNLNLEPNREIEHERRSKNKEGVNDTFCVRSCYRRRHHDSVVLSFRIPGAAGKASRR